MTKKELTPQQRAEGFKKEYNELVEKWGIDFQARVQPAMGLVDKKPKEDDKKRETN